MKRVRETDKEYTCPFCNSDNFAKSRKPKSIVGLLLLFFGLPLPIFKDDFYCFDCRNEFKINNAS